MGNDYFSLLQFFPEATNYGSISKWDREINDFSYFCCFFSLVFPNSSSSLFFFLRVFTESVTILLLFYVLVFQPWDMWDLNSLTRDQAHTLSIRRRRLNHWPTGKIPFASCFYFFLSIWWVFGFGGSGLLFKDTQIQKLNKSRKLTQSSSSNNVFV